MNAEHNTPEWLKFVDHTADAGIMVEAPDLARLFERAPAASRGNEFQAKAPRWHNGRISGPSKAV